MHPRLINQAFENPDFKIQEESLGYFVRDVINMNWWNTSNVLLGYEDNHRITGPFSETQKRIAVQLKEFYRYRILALRNERKFRDEIRAYLAGTTTLLPQLNAWSTPCRANPSQYFHKPDGTMTWVDCTSRATYAAKYVFQNGYVDWDGKCRVLGASEILRALSCGALCDLGISDFFEEGDGQVKAEIFSQKHEQRTIQEWITHLRIQVLPERQWLLDRIGHVRTDPFKNYESALVKQGQAPGVNERLYGFATFATLDTNAVSGASSASNVSHESRSSRASNASHASSASNASSASRASTASTASYASSASHVSQASDTSYVGRASRTSYVSRISNLSAASDVSRASDTSRASAASNASDVSRASNVSRASHANTASTAGNASAASDSSYASSARHESHSSDAGRTTFTGDSWAKCATAITKPDGLVYPKEFRSNIFAIAGNWKINPEIVQLAKKGWFDPFSGHGTSPLYAARYGIRYLGFDTNTRAFKEYLHIVREECEVKSQGHVTIRNADSTVFDPSLVGQFDLCYTSPPYFNFEEYGGNTAHYQGLKNYDEYHEKITRPVFTNVARYLTEDGILALQTEKNATYKNLWKQVLLSLGYQLLADTITGREATKYSQLSKRDQTLLLFRAPQKHHHAHDSLPGGPKV